MPIILDFKHFLKEQVSPSDTGFNYKLGIPIITQIQKGQTCKLHALSIALNSMHDFYKSPQPLPLRKIKNSDITYSLRQLAKEKYDSKVGEIYSAKTLVSLANDNGYSSHVLRKKNYQEYAQTVIASIDNGDVPILFYDIDIRGEPGFYQSQREHASVVAGYYFDKNEELGFIINTWDAFYWAKAELIFQSASQLSSCRTPEVFFKYESGWYDLNNIRYHSPKLFQKASSQRREALPLPKNDGGLKNKIFIVERPSSYKGHFFKNEVKNELSESESEKLLRQTLEQKGICYENGMSFKN